MDMQALGDDLSKSLRLLPRPLVEKLINVVAEFQKELGATFPTIVGTMLPHIMAAMPEKAMGILDVPAITATLGGVLADYLADRSAADRMTKTPVDVGQDVRR